MTSIVNLSRRRFLRASGGLVLGLHLSGFSELPELDGVNDELRQEGASPGTELNAWIHLHLDGTASIRVGAVEMGQGVYTALPMLLAEELDLPFERVRVVPAPTEKAFRRPSSSYPGRVLMTGASESVRGHWDLLRRAGAQARAMLIAEAAERWKVRPGACSVREGTVVCADRRLDYSELVEGAARRSPNGGQPKEPQEWRLIGTSPPRTDIAAKVSGEAVFGIDVELAGMVFASARACPHHGGELVSVDETTARQVAGVLDVFSLEDAVVVVADSYWTAQKAAKLLKISWAPGQGAGWDDDQILAKLQEAVDEAPVVHRRGGGARAVDIEATFSTPYLAHAPLEPLNATVSVGDSRIDIWAPTQAQQAVQNRASEITGFPKAQCFVHSTLVGGGFGRKSMSDFTDQAIEIGVRVGKPVKLIWTREETFTRGKYRPATACRLRARLGSDGYPTDFEATIASQNVLDGRLPDFLLALPPIAETVHGGLGDTPYVIARETLRYKRVRFPIPVGWWRSVHGSHNGFYRESFFDELAHSAGIDPTEYRRHLLRDSPRHLSCYELVLAQAPPLAEGQHRGTAVFKSFGSIVATVVDLSLHGSDLQIHRITTAVDCGIVVHPDTVHAQLMGATLMGLSAALHERVPFSEGASEVRNFDGYRILSMAETPTVDTHIVSSTESPGGVGEVALPPLAGALANAIFNASGFRLRTLPIGDQLDGLPSKAGD